MNKCPYCAEEIQPETIICPWCSRDIRKPPSAKNVYAKRRRFRYPALFWGTIIGIGMMGLTFYMNVVSGTPLLRIIDLSLTNMVFFTLLVTMAIGIVRSVIRSLGGKEIDNGGSDETKTDAEKKIDQNTAQAIRITKIIFGVFVGLFIIYCIFITSVAINPRINALLFSFSPTHTPTTSRVINTPSPKRSFPTSTHTQVPPTATRPRTTSTVMAGYDCVEWNKLTPADEGKELCVYGELVDIVEIVSPSQEECHTIVKGAGGGVRNIENATEREVCVTRVPYSTTYWYFKNHGFSSHPYLSGFSTPLPVGSCIWIKGSIMFDDEGVPTMNGDFTYDWCSSTP